VNKRVRKHPAPEGALRRVAFIPASDTVASQKAPSTRRCIKTHAANMMMPAMTRSESTQHQKVH